MQVNKIGFLESYSTDTKSGLMGAILVTDIDTKPLEFRVTAPIKPTNFQKTLYGDVLLEHIQVELISVPLISALSGEVDLILVRDPLFLGANDKQNVRVVRIFEKSEKKNNNFVSEEIPAPWNGGEVCIESGKKFQSELPEIKEMLSEISSKRNIIEPFERLKLACEQVQLQKTNE